MDIGKAEPPQSFKHRFLSDIDCDGIAVDSIHHDIGEKDIFDQCVFPSPVFVVGIREVDSDAILGLGDNQIGKSAVAYHPVIGPSQTYTAGMGTQDTVRNRTPLHRFVFMQGTAVRPEHDRIVSAFDMAVGDGHVPGTVQMDSVIVRIFQVCKDLKSPDGDPVTIVDPVAPSGRLVRHGHIFQKNVLASCEKDDPRERLFIRIDPFILPPPGIGRLFQFLYVIGSIPVDDSPSGNGNPLGLIGKDDAGIPIPSRKILTDNMLRIGPFRIILNIRRRQETGCAVDIQVDAVFELDGAGQIHAIHQDDPSSPSLGTRVDRFLDRFRILLGTVAFRPELAHIEIGPVERRGCEYQRQDK